MCFERRCSLYSRCDDVSGIAVDHGIHGPLSFKCATRDSHANSRT